MDIYESMREAGDYSNMLNYIFNNYKQKEKVKQMGNVTINWGPNKSNKTLYFADLAVNDSFRIKDHDAIYLKIAPGRGASFGPNTSHLMLEIATGRAFAATGSPVEHVPVEINISTSKPGLYGG